MNDLLMIKDLFIEPFSSNSMPVRSVDNSLRFKGEVIYSKINERDIHKILFYGDTCLSQ